MIISKYKAIFRLVKRGFKVYSAKHMSIPQNVDKGEKMSPVVKSKKDKDPFMKNTFVGSLEDDFLQFTSGKSKNLPDVLNNICYKFKGDNAPSSVRERFKLLTESNFLKYSSLCQLEKENISCTDLLHFFELLDLDPNLTALLEVHSSSIVPVLTQHGSAEQLEKYLRRLMSGEVTGAFAVTEPSGGADPTSVKTLAQEDSSGNFKVTGEKLWVTNAAEADFYIVLAKVPLTNLRAGKGEFVNDLSAFILDKSNDIDVKSHNLVGLNDSGIARLNFNNVSVSSDCMLGSAEAGYKIVTENLKNPKFLTLICILNKLKLIASDVLKHINERKQFPRDLKENEFALKEIKNIMNVIYTFESMLYFTADLIDRYNIDISLESALLNVYGFDVAFKSLSRGMTLLGAKLYDSDYPYEKLNQDLKGLSMITPSSLTRIYASLIGLDYAGNYLRDTIIKTRNPFNYPGFIFKKILRERQFSQDKIKYTLKLYRNFHPTLKEAAEQLEYCILSFQRAIEGFLSRHGSEVVHRLMDLERISEVALEIFSMSSVLTRASHSYCTGLQDCDEEVLMTRVICYQSLLNCRRVLDQLTSFESQTSDSITVDLATKALLKKGYYIQHPLEHDI